MASIVGNERREVAVSRESPQFVAENTVRNLLDAVMESFGAYAHPFCCTNEAAKSARQVTATIEFPSPEDITYPAILELVERISSVKGLKLPDPTETPSLQRLLAYGVEQIREAKLPKGSIIPILIPGNNDPTTVMFAASFIRGLQPLVTEEGYTFEVLIMGKGGHPTTALFHQFISLEPGKVPDFNGVPEALSLSETLQSALGRDSNVTIKIAKDSTNTGQNVKEASEKYPKMSLGFIIAPAPSAIRQAFTFVEQLTSSWGSLCCIPVARSPAFSKRALSDFQAYVEVLAFGAEAARLIQYSLQKKPFLPRLSIPKEFVDRTYSLYAILSGKTLAKSKDDSISVVLKFFAEKFQTAEAQIPWERDPAKQVLARENEMRKLQGRFVANSRSSHMD